MNELYNKKKTQNSNKNKKILSFFDTFDQKMGHKKKFSRKVGLKKILWKNEFHFYFDATNHSCMHLKEDIPLLKFDINGGGDIKYNF